MSTGLLVLPSPLLPGDAYATLAAALRDLGHDCLVADASGAQSGRQLVDRWAAGAAPGTRLVAHSNAGYLAPAVRAAIGSRDPVLFMDAALPPSSGDTALAPPELRRHLDTLVDESTGLLPPWTRWWPQDVVLGVIPEPVFEAIDTVCPRLSTSYFDSRVPAPDGWADAPHRYLAFGDTYADEVARAHRLGWSVVTTTGSHLQFLHDPATVAGTIDGLLRAATAQPELRDVRRAGRSGDRNV